MATQLEIPFRELRPRPGTTKTVPVQVVDQPSALDMGFANDPAFREKLSRLGRASGWALAGVPLALNAAGELGQDGNVASDLAGAGGEALGGIAGGLAAAKMMPFPNPYAKAAAFALGSVLGGDVLGKVTRWGADVVQGRNDPLGRELSDQDRRFQAGLRQAEAEAALLAKYEALRQQQAMQNAAFAKRLDMDGQFQLAAMNAASSGMDPAALAYMQAGLI